MIASRGVTRIGRVLAVHAFILAVLVIAPAPTWLLWLLHMLALEASLVVTLLALLALALVRRGVRQGERGARVARGLALIAALVGLLPFATTAPLWRGGGTPLSIVEYLRGFAAPPATVERDVELGVPGLRADLFRLSSTGAHPLVVVVHGGSWQHGDKGEAPEMSAALAGAGFVVADVQYRLAPAHRFPGAVADVKCLVGRLRERAESLAIDGGRVALLGRSAGGEIALVAAYSTGDARLKPACDVRDAAVQAVVALYAPTDLAWGHDHPPFPDPIDGPGSIEAYLGGVPSAVPEAYRLASPSTWADRPLPPTLLVHGSADRLVPVEHARRLSSALAAQRRPVQTLLIPMADHGFDRRPGGIGEQLARAAILAFLRRI
jgi:acetyl esterase/lipase